MLLPLLLLAEAACPKGRELVVDVPRWAQALKAARPERYDELLSALQLPAVGEAGPKSVEVHVLQSRTRAPARLVIADFTLDPSRHLFRVQVLQPTRPGASCALGSQLSREVQLTRRSPCPAGDDEPDTFTSIDFRFTPLDDAAHPAIEVIETTRQDSCRGIFGSRSTHAFWSATDDGLRALMELSEGQYSLAMGGGDVREWFVLSPKLPRSAEQFRRQCLPGEECTTTSSRLAPPQYREQLDDGGTPDP